MKLSIIVPVYAAEKYLYENMMTIIPQLTSECELILIDDGSKDASGKICDALAEISPYIIVIHKQNGGVSSARNAGIKAARGEFLTFVDSDDRVKTDYVRQVLELTSDHCDIGFFAADTFGNGTPDRMKPWLSDLQEVPDIYTAYDLLFCNKSNEPWDKVFKKEIIEANNLVFSEGVQLGEDIIFNLDYIVFCKTIAITDKIIYSYCTNSLGLSKKKNSLSTLQYHNAVFSKLLSTARKTCAEEKYLQYAKESILQILTNYCGKLLKSGLDKNQIYAAINCYDWYKEVASANYKGIKNSFRVFLLRRKQYKLISFFFNK